MKRLICIGGIVGVLGVLLSLSLFLFLNDQKMVNNFVHVSYEVAFYGRLSGPEVRFDDGLHEEKILQIRENIKSIAKDNRDGIVPSPGKIEDVLVKMRDGHENIMRVYHNPNKEEGKLSPPLLWIHGGGFCVGSYYQSDMALVDLTHSANITIFSVQYRLAPEHKHPQAVEDVMDHLEWLRNNALFYSADPSQIIVGGASAGGNLAAVVSILSRDQKVEPSIKMQLLVAPLVDIGMDKYPSYQSFASGYGLTKQVVIGFLSCYIGTDFYLSKDPTFVPIYANLTSLPPALVVVYDSDVLCDEGKEYAKALHKSGTKAKLLEVEGLHCGPLLAPFLHSRQHSLFLETVSAEIWDNLL